MKNLFLLFALVFSMGAFAQKPIKYEPIPEPCLYVFDFVPKCSNMRIGTYELSVCGHRLDPKYETMADQIAAFVCEYGSLPGGVTIVKFTPYSPYKPVIEVAVP